MNKKLSLIAKKYLKLKAKEAALYKEISVLRDKICREVCVGDTVVGEIKITKNDFICEKVKSKEEIIDLHGEDFLIRNELLKEQAQLRLTVAPLKKSSKKTKTK